MVAVEMRDGKIIRHFDEDESREPMKRVPEGIEFRASDQPTAVEHRIIIS
jgi:hypothetical protein